MPLDFPFIDTYNLAAQASAAKLIRLLQTAYPYVQSLSQPLEDKPSAVDDTHEGQLALQKYLQFLVFGTPFDPRTKDKMENSLSVQGTIKWIDYIRGLPSEKLSEDDKKRVFSQLYIITNNYPKRAWYLNDTQWNTNQFYNKETGTQESLMTPPAEVLNLVCTALFDKERYLSTEDTWQSDFDLRAQTCYTHLRNLRVQIEKGDKEQCGGLQHDILYFLDGCYLDQSNQSKDAKPVRLLVEPGKFLESLLSRFVERQIEERKKDETTHQMILEWIHWHSISESADENPLIVWLRFIFPSSDEDPNTEWMNQCEKYIIEQYQLEGLNPISFSRKEILAIEDLSPVLSEPILILLFTIIETKKLNVLETDRSDGTIFHLVNLSNHALTQFKAQMKSIDLRHNAEGLKHFFTALQCVTLLYSQRDLVLFGGDSKDKKLFQENETTLIRTLLDYFTGFSLEKRLTADYEAHFLTYKILKTLYGESIDLIFIENFFKEYPKDFQRLEKINLPMLADSDIEKWKQQNVSDDGKLLDVTRFASMRLLLQGITTPPETWTPSYCDALEKLLDALFVMQFDKQFDSNYKIKEGIYFKEETNNKEAITNVLVDLKFVLLLKKASLYSDFKKSCLPSIGSIKMHAKENQFYVFFEQPVSEVDSALRDRVFSLCKDQLHLLINSDLGLIKLLGLPIENFSDTHRKIVITELNPQLIRLFSNKHKVLNLLDQSSPLLKPLKYALPGALKTHLGEIIDTFDTVTDLVKIIHKKMGGDLRTEIFKHLETKWTKLIQTPENLLRLFKFVTEKFNSTHRLIVVKSIGANFAHFVKLSKFWELFDLQPNLFPMDHQEQFWASVERQSRTFTQSVDDVFEIFNLSDSVFKTPQRIQFFKAIEKNLSSMSINVKGLVKLFRLPLSKLNRGQRNRVWQAIVSKLSGLTLDPDYMQLTTLTLENLNEDQIKKIWLLWADQLIIDMQHDEVLHQYVPDHLRVTGGFPQQVAEKGKRPTTLIIEDDEPQVKVAPLADDGAITHQSDVDKQEIMPIAKAKRPTTATIEDEEPQVKTAPRVADQAISHQSYVGRHGVMPNYKSMRPASPTFFWGSVQVENPQYDDFEPREEEDYFEPTI